MCEEKQHAGCQVQVRNGTTDDDAGSASVDNALDVNSKGAMLERVSNKHIEDFPSSTLYLDDVAELIDTFGQACERIEATAGEFKIADPAELNALAAKFDGGRFADLKIQGYEPYVSLELSAIGARAYISEDSLEQRGVVSKVREILHRQRKARPGLLVDLASGLLIAVGVWQIIEKAYLLGLPLVVAALGLFAFSVRLRLKNTVVVYSKSRADTKGFLQRKKDDVLLAIISAALGAAASYAATKLLP